MRIKVGDRVRFLNDIGGGVVKKIVDKQMVEIQTKDGWDMPYLISELVVIPEDPDQEPFRAESESDSGVSKRSHYDKLTTTASDASLQVSLLAVQETDDSNGVFSGLKWYVVNDSNFVVKFAFYQINEDSVSLIEVEELEAGTKLFIQELSLAELSVIKGFQIQGLLIQTEAQSVPPLISKWIPFNVKKFSSSGAYVENDFLHEPAIVFDLIAEDVPIIETFAEDKESLNAQLNATQEFRSGKKNEKAKEVDLHINQLVDSVIGLSNREILRIQMDRFTTELNEAIQSTAQEIIFIHGIGNGTLKETLRKAISDDYPVCSQEDASFKEYGFGAT
ncbi:MAG: DUF2027 domain-containing protein, partial [Bacteroidales bacterium]|nr:DUF2027 domain-containing protein [Bacteroidales bacterium]